MLVTTPVDQIGRGSHVQRLPATLVAGPCDTKIEEQVFGSTTYRWRQQKRPRRAVRIRALLNTACTKDWRACILFPVQKVLAPRESDLWVGDGSVTKRLANRLGPEPIARIHHSEFAPLFVEPDHRAFDHSAVPIVGRSSVQDDAALFKRCPGGGRVCHGKQELMLRVRRRYFRA